MYGSASARIFAFSSAVGPVRAMWLSGLANVKGFYTTAGNKKGGRPCGVPPFQPLPERLLDGDAFDRLRRFLRQLELEYAVGIPRLGRVLVAVLTERKRAVYLTVVALRAQHFFTVLGLFFVLHFGVDFDLVAVDPDVDVFLLDARNFGAHHVAGIIFGHVH